jgi:hypothetical protein
MNRNKRPTGQSPTHLTVETALWILIGAVALALRLARVDAAPLSSREAREAVLAWRAVTGQGMPEGGYSPLLFGANALLFALCGTSDVLARLWPALCGTALTVTPFLLRRRIGRVGALATGVCLALSPTLLSASRQLDGAVVAALGGMAFLSGILRFFEAGVGEGDGRSGRVALAFAVGGLSLAVTSSSSAYGLLFALGLATSGLVWAWPSGETRRLWMLFKPHLSYVLVIFLLAGLALSTALGWNLGGLGAAGDLLPAWIVRFGPAADLIASPLVLLSTYELFILVLGLGGLVWSIRRGRRFGVLLGMWAGIGVLLLCLMPGRKALDTVWVLLPLTMLAGVAIEQLLRGLWRHGDWFSEGLHIPVVLFLWAHFYLMLTRYVVSDNPVEQNTSLALALMTVALQGLLAAVFALTLRVSAALRSVAVGTALVLLATMLSAGWGVAYTHPSDPRELLAHEPTAVEVRDLVQTLRDLSWHDTGLPQTLPFTLDAGPDSVLAWYLRDFAAKKEGVGEDTGGGESVVVTARLAPDPPNAPEGDYVGQEFTLCRSWDSEDIACIWGWPPQCRSAVRWWLFRDTAAVPVVDERAVLWVARDRP